MACRVEASISRVSHRTHTAFPGLLHKLVDTGHVAGEARRRHCALIPQPLRGPGTAVDGFDLFAVVHSYASPSPQHVETEALTG